MNKIFISGGGGQNTSYEFDKLYKTSLCESRRILYIPWAFYPSKYPGAKERIDQLFPSTEGFYVNMMREDENIDLENIISYYDGIYIGGGNTFRLLRLIKETDFIDVINEFADKGKAIYGGSAGAIILGKEINTSPDLNIERLDIDNTFGLNYFNGYSIFCHYTEEKDEEIYDYVKNYNIPVIALPEGVGLYTNDNKFIVGGVGKAYIFDKDGKTKINSGESILIK